MLDLKIDRAAAPPKDAATVILVRDRAEGAVEVFCVERSKQSRFLGGAIVFPGGKLDPSDASDDWTGALATAVRSPRPSSVAFTTSEAHLRSLAIAAARETLEEAALLHVVGASGDRELVSDRELLDLRGRLSSDPGALRAFLHGRGLKLDLSSLHPLSRWITPEAEARRYDARFFVAIAPEGQSGAHDEHETMASFWATPSNCRRKMTAATRKAARPQPPRSSPTRRSSASSVPPAPARASRRRPSFPTRVTS